MPHYLLSVCYPAGAQPPSPEQLQTIMADVATLNEEMRAARVWVFGGGLHEPSTATVVTRQDGESVLTDGPFVETKEQVGGITIIEAPDPVSYTHLTLPRSTLCRSRWSPYH